MTMMMIIIIFIIKSLYKSDFGPPLGRGSQVVGLYAIGLQCNRGCDFESWWFGGRKNSLNLQFQK